MEVCCELCQENCVVLVPVLNRDVTIPFEHVLICSSCLDVEQFEHADELLWSPVDFVSLNNGRLRKVAA